MVRCRGQLELKRHAGTDVGWVGEENSNAWLKKYEMLLRKFTWKKGKKVGGMYFQCITGDGWWSHLRVNSLPNLRERSIVITIV